MENKRKKEVEIREQSATYDDYAALPDIEGVYYELVDGKLELMSPGPSPFHQMVSGELNAKVRQSCESDYLILTAPTDVILSKKDVRQPDMLMIHRSRLSIITKRGVEGPPDLVVEILSPHSIRRDKIGKNKTYAKFGVPEFWIVDPFSGSLEQYVLEGERYELIEVYVGEEPVRSDKLPCVGFTMKEIMDRIPVLPDNEK